jgi:hypothetical protein
MKKTKKLVLNKERLRTLMDSSLERAQGGAMYNTGSDRCSSQTYAKCPPTGNNF